MRLFVLTRHGQSELNVTHHVNGDPAVSVELTAQGEEESARLGVRARRDRARSLRPYALRPHARRRPSSRWPDGACRSRSSRSSTTSTSATSRGSTIDDYRAWKRAHTRGDAFPGGESLDDAARRYARAYERLLARPERRILVVCHEIPVRYAVNAASGSDDLDGPCTTSRTASPTSSTRTGSGALRRGSAAARRLPLPRPLPAVPKRRRLGSSRRC